MTQSLFSLEKRIALITGGNGGLGRAIALGFQAAGATVAVTGRDVEKNRKVGAAVFLGAPASDFVTGIALPVDGGYSVTDRLLYE